MTHCYRTRARIWAALLILVFHQAACSDVPRPPDASGSEPEVGKTAAALTSQSCSTATTNACAFYQCGCLNNECSGGACANLSDGCTDQMRSACAFYTCGCANNVCFGGGTGCPMPLPNETLPTTSPLFNIATERAALLNGVASPVRIGDGAAPSGIAMFDAKSFPVLVSGQTTVVAASHTHSGRAVAFAHPDFFWNEVLGNPGFDSTTRLIVNAANWVTRGKPAPVIGVIGGAGGIADALGAPFTLQTITGAVTASSLAGLDAVALIGYEARTESEIQALETFHINGGGLLVASLGWVWVQDPLHELREMPGNRVLARAHMGFTDAFVEPAAIPVQATPPSISHAVHAYNYLRTAPVPTTQQASADIRRIQGYVRDAIPLLTLPSKLRSSLHQLMLATQDLYPSVSRPLDPVDQPFQTLGLMYAARRVFDPAEIKAHPAATDFPGAVPASAPRLENATIPIDTSVPGWHSTGLYAPPGELLGVLVPAQATAAKLKLRIGAHTDQLWHRGQKHTAWHGDDLRWTRVPEITRTFPLDRNLLQAGSDFGGLVYVMVPEGTALGTISILITKAVAAPRFKLGTTTDQSWNGGIRNLQAPFGELEADNVVLTFDARLLRTLSNPTALISRWRSSNAWQDELAQWPAGRRKRPDRIVFDRQTSTGYMHAGYPIVSPDNEAPTLVSTSAFTTTPTPGALWGMFHELGHEHQHADWTFAGTEEVTNNLFTMYAIERETGFPKETGIEDVTPAGQHRYLCWYFWPKATDAEQAPPHIVRGTFEHWKHNPFIALQMYIQLMDTLETMNGGGDPWAPYRNVFKFYADNPLGYVDDNAKRDAWLVRMSYVANANLVPFFDAWKIPVSQDARNWVAWLNLRPFTWSPPTQNSCL